MGTWGMGAGGSGEKNKGWVADYRLEMRTGRKAISVCLSGFSFSFLSSLFPSFCYIVYLFVAFLCLSVCLSVLVALPGLAWHGLGPFFFTYVVGLVWSSLPFFLFLVCLVLASQLLIQVLPMVSLSHIFLFFVSVSGLVWAR